MTNIPILDKQFEKQEKKRKARMKRIEENLSVNPELDEEIDKDIDQLLQEIQEEKTLKHFKDNEARLGGIREFVRNRFRSSRSPER